MAVTASGRKMTGPFESWGRISLGMFFIRSRAKSTPGLTEAAQRKPSTLAF